MMVIRPLGSQNFHKSGDIKITVRYYNLEVMYDNSLNLTGVCNVSLLEGGVGADVGVRGVEV